jgi:hypothetical protein
MRKGRLLASPASAHKTYPLPPTQRGAAARETALTNVRNANAEYWQCWECPGKGDACGFPHEAKQSKCSPGISKAHHRSDAATLAKETAAALKAKGDHDGHNIWNDVADTMIA